MTTTPDSPTSSPTPHLTPAVPISPNDKTTGFPDFCLNYISTHDVDDLTNGQLATLFGNENSEHFLINIASARSLRLSRLSHCIKREEGSESRNPDKKEKEKSQTARELLAILKAQT